MVIMKGLGFREILPPIMENQKEKSIEHEMAHVILWWCLGIGTEAQGSKEWDVLENPQPKAETKGPASVYTAR